MLWDDPDARRLQESYEIICKNYKESLKEIRKKMGFKLILLTLIDIPCIVARDYLKQFAICHLCVCLYVIFLISIIYNAELKEEDFYKKILKKFIEIDYKFELVDKNHDKWNEILKRIKNGYNFFDIETLDWTIKDIINGYLKDNIEISIAQIKRNGSGNF